MVLDTSILLVPCKDKEPIPTQYRPTFSRSILGACAFEHKRDVAILPTTKRQKRECVQEMMDSVKVGIQSDTGTIIHKPSVRKTPYPAAQLSTLQAVGSA